MPHTFQTVSFGPHDHRGALAASTAVVESGQIIRKQLEAVEQVI